MASTAWVPGEESPVVGVVDRESDANRAIDDALEPALADRDATLVAGDLADVRAASPSLVVAGGETATTALARAEIDAPVLPTGEIDGVAAVPRENVASGLERALDGEATVRERTVLRVALEDGRVRDERALFDVTLVTDEPARISEYGLRSRGRSVATVRADGVVVATPAGSRGYAARLEAPRLSPAVDAVAVAPIAPFVVGSRQWILPDDGIELGVERDEGDVTLVVDDRPVATVTTESRVAVAADGALATLSVPESVLEGE